jgi:hypothetical protein
MLGIVLTAVGVLAAVLVVPEVRQALGLRPVDVHVDVRVSPSDEASLPIVAADGASRPASSAAQTPTPDTPRQRPLSAQANTLGIALPQNQDTIPAGAPTRVDNSQPDARRDVESPVPAPTGTHDASREATATVPPTQSTSSAVRDPATVEFDKDDALRFVEPTPSNSTSSSAALGKFKGMWKGMIFQAGALPYSVTMSVVGGQPNEIVGEIEYPRLKCGGRLRILSVSDQQIHVAEELTFGATKCIPGGEIIVSTDDGRQGVWQWSNGTPRYVTTAKVRRE